MRVVVRGSSFLASLLAPGRNASVPEAALMLRRGSAGDVYVGMPEGDVNASGRDFTAEMFNGVVAAIRVHSRRYKTDAGIGVGDSLIALANHYQIHWTDDNVAEVEDLRMKFQIERERIVSILIL